VTTLAPNDFTHLHVHSEFSLDGLGQITELVDAAAQAGMDLMAITDHGALYGSVAFYQAATKAGIKPIIGVETYVARRSMTDKEGKADAQPFHLILLAQDVVGYRNLCRLVTDAHIDGYYYKPRIDREHLARHSEGYRGCHARRARSPGARGRGPGAARSTSGDIFARSLPRAQDHMPDSGAR
jgi:DNA polymerase-3 subunit alpha